MRPRRCEVVCSSHFLFPSFHHRVPCVYVRRAFYASRSFQDTHHHSALYSSIRGPASIPVSVHAFRMFTCSAIIFFFNASRSVGVSSPSSTACLMRFQRVQQYVITASSFCFSSLDFLVSALM